MTTDVLSDQDVAEKLKHVCKSLDWKADPPSEEYHHVHLKARLDGFPSASVSISYGRYPNEGRITVTAYTDHDSAIYRYGEKHLSISVHATRSSNQIVKEIQRRFIPAFVEIAKKAQEIEKRHQDHKQSLESCLGGLKGEPLDDVEKHSSTIHLHVHSIWGSVRYDGDGEVSLDFHSVPAERAQRILEILREPAVVRDESPDAEGRLNP